MKDNKQRLFEMMGKVDKSFKLNLNESKTYVKSSEIPQEIIKWARSIVGKGFENKITIEKVNDKITIGMPWHDADKETHQFFKLIQDGAQSAGDSVSKTGWSEAQMMDEPYGTVEIPSGYVLATVGTYPKRLRITVSGDAMDMIGNNDELLNTLSDDELVALNNAVMLKSPYRQKFDDSVYQELTSKGLLNPRKAITIDGRNLAKSPKTIERLRELKKKDQEENGWSTKYQIEI